MNIAELFVNLGVKGSEKTLNVFGHIKSALGDIAMNTSIFSGELLAMGYAFEKLSSPAARMGMNLENFTALTGMSAQQLQKWQYAALQAGESGDEFTSSLKAVYDKMAQMRLNKGQPEGLDILARAVGFDYKRAYKDSFYVMEQLQKFAHSNVPLAIQNQVFKGFGVSEGTVAAMRKGVFNKENFDKAPKYEGNDVKRLAQLQVVWANLEQKIGVGMGKLFVKHGPEMAENFGKIADSVFELIDAFSTLLEKLKAMEWITEMFKDWAWNLGLVTKLVNWGNKSQGEKAEMISKWGLEKYKQFNDFTGQLTDKVADFIGAGDSVHSASNESRSPVPYGPPTPSKVTTIHHSQTVNMQNHFQNNDQHAHKNANEVHKQIRGTHKQLSSQGQGG